MPFPFHVKEHKFASQHVREWPRATANSQEDILYVAVKQYIPVDNPNPQPGDVTIIGAHANGFPKELYEPLWEDLHAASKHHGFRIRSIWIADVANQGASGILNEQSLGNDPSWYDHARDLLHMTNVFRADMPRPIIGMGHSFGGNCLTQLALLHPRLLTTLVLFDPVVIRFSNKLSHGAGVSPARLSTWRRDTWPSREAAADSFRRSPFYKSWDPRVLDAWIEHAIRETPTPLFPDPKASGGATLTTTRHQEVFTFFRPLWPYVLPNHTVSREGAPDFDVTMNDKLGPGVVFPFYRSEGGDVLKRLPFLRPSVLWVFGGDSDLSMPESRQLKLSTTGTGPGGSGGAEDGRVSEVVMPRMGHLFPMEIPGQCAEHAATWISKEMDLWHNKEREYLEWTRLPLREKSTLSEEYVKRIGPLPPRPDKKTSSGAQSKL